MRQRKNVDDLSLGGDTSLNSVQRIGSSPHPTDGKTRRENTNSIKITVHSMTREYDNVTNNEH